MKRQLLLGLGMFALISLAFVVNKDEVKTLRIGSKAPMSEVKMESTSGKSVSLDDEKGEKGLVVIFSCNTCPFVIGSPQFEGWNRQYNQLKAYATSNKVGLVVINSNSGKRDGDDSFENMKKFATSHNYTMEYLLDEHAAMANAFGAKTTPHVFLFDEKMKLKYRGSIDNTWDTKRERDFTYLRDAIDGLYSGFIDQNDTKPVGCSIKRVNHSKTK